MKKIALTGGIGSGKTIVARLFEILGIPIYYSDLRAKELMIQDEDLMAAIQKSFGQESYLEGQLNRAYLAERVFNDTHQLELLNDLVHPAVFRDQEKWFSTLNAPYAIVESAIIIELGREASFDHVLLVTAPEDLRIKRIKARDGATESSIRKRMDAQLSQEEKLKKADFRIVNNEQESLIEQVMQIHQQLSEQGTS